MEHSIFNRILKQNDIRNNGLKNMKSQVYLDEKSNTLSKQEIDSNVASLSTNQTISSLDVPNSIQLLPKSQTLGDVASCLNICSSKPPKFHETFGKEFVRQMVLLITASFSFVVALAFNEAITETINLHAPKNAKKHLETKWIYFAVIFVFAIVIIAIISAAVKSYVVV
jgi:hypothetical protein